jgi:hypothetical protein
MRSNVQTRTIKLGSLRALTGCRGLVFTGELRKRISDPLRSWSVAARSRPMPQAMPTYVRDGRRWGRRGFVAPLCGPIHRGFSPLMV